ncbi:MAG: aspartate--tRNA ligase [Candidatus Omnitrophica bacterium]|nr:aspartate--tRNA ligase [Candidatus Omnitrophota bacterium]
MLRTHTCGELRPTHKDQEVVLTGWVHRRRDHGKLIFIDIRDRYGVTQVVFVPSVAKEAHNNAQKLGPEFVVRIKGQVNVRPDKNANPDLATGGVELLAKELEILNESKVPVFEIDGDVDVEVNEETRLTYRYLDIRRAKIRESLLMRHKLSNTVRAFLNAENFCEVETPVLTKSTPEGARDFLVPSRMNQGQFYALPQSPQLFKQLLMVSGMDRYYQIVKCFRDEDLRSDRQPEFTQIDMEMSFVDEEDVYALTERMFQKVLKEVKGIDLPIPFPRMSHAEAMAKYGCDKPDIRKDKNDPNEFAFLWVTEFPLFKWNAEEKRWDSEHHPFTSVHPDDVGRLDGTDLNNIRSRAYDLVLNGNEIGSGSIRIHRREMQKRIFDIIGIAPEEIESRFGFLLRAFEYGAPPHAGVAYGLDRLVAILSGLDSIRDTIAFPKTQKGSCPLSSAPSAVNDKQLQELGVAVLKKSKGA